MTSTSSPRFDTFDALSCGIILSVFLADFANAQTAASVTDGGALEEITVTAQRRSERLQDVPISVSAFSAETLKNSNILTTDELGTVTAGLFIDVDATYIQPHLRGVGTIASSASIENPVAIYIDGVYIAATAGATFSLNNISQVEVDKGPQGTLFGRNATGGLIQVNTRDPSDNFGWSGSLTYGNYNTAGGDLYVTGGITPTIAADLSINYSGQFDGYGKNAFTGKDVNKTQALSVRDKWLFTPSDQTRMVLTMDFERTQGSPALIPAPGTTPVGGPPYTGPRQGMDGVYQPTSLIEAGGISLRIEQNLGFANLMSLTAYRRNNLDLLYYSIVTDPNFSQQLHILDENREISQEFQLKSPESESLKWVTGAYLYDDNAKYDPVTIYDPVGFVPFNSLSAYSSVTTLSAALYGQATAEILPSTNLTVGLRFTEETHKASNSAFLSSLSSEQIIAGTDISPGSPGSIGLGTAQGQLTIYKPTWRVALDHHFLPDLMGYISYNRGFKSGGYNDYSQPLVPYKAETIDAYELGLKAQPFDRRLTVDAATFYYEYKNVQTIEYSAGLPNIYNGTGATLYGLDLDIAAKVTSQLTVTASGEVMHSQYGNFPLAPNSFPLPGGGTGFTTLNAKGHQVAQAPNYTASISAGYTVPTTYGAFKANAVYSYNGGWYAEPDNRLRQLAYSIVNTQLAFTPDHTDWTVKLWAKNLFNEQYLMALGSNASGDFASYAPPRTFGVTIEKPI